MFNAELFFMAQQLARSKTDSYRARMLEYGLALNYGVSRFHFESARSVPAHRPAACLPDGHKLPKTSRKPVAEIVLPIQTTDDHGHRHYIGAEIFRC